MFEAYRAAGQSSIWKSKGKNQMFLKSILARCERTKRNEEIGKLPTVAQLTLHEDQTLQRYVSRKPKLPSEVVYAQIDPGSRAQIIVGKLRDDRVCAFDRKDV